MCVNNGLGLQLAPGGVCSNAESERCVLPETADRTVAAVVEVRNGPKLCLSREGVYPLAKHAELSQAIYRGDLFRLA